MKDLFTKRSDYKAIAAVIIASAVLLFSGSYPLAAHAAQGVLTVGGSSLIGEKLSMWVQVKDGQAIVKSGFTPMTFYGTYGKQYTVAAHDYSAGSVWFAGWSDGVTAKERPVTLGSNGALEAKYITKNSELKISAVDQDGGALHMWTTVKDSAGHTVTGFTPFVYRGQTNSEVAVSISDYGQLEFRSWEDGGDRVLAINMYGSKEMVAAYTDHSKIPKADIYVALYKWPGGDGWLEYQKVVDAKLAHPDVNVVLTLNPSSGPGSSRIQAFADASAKLHAAGVKVIGYVPDGYADSKSPGSRTMAYMKDAIYKHRAWYGTDGIFLDEMSNRPGNEGRYAGLTSYAKSLGMELVVGNPGTLVPQSYIGTVDVLNIQEGPGYPQPGWESSPLIAGNAKENFSIMRYDVDYLDAQFVKDAVEHVGMIYVTDGDDSNARWFGVPPYFEDLVAAVSPT
jgi:hypothetical protein